MGSGMTMENLQLNRVVIGISDMQISHRPEDLLVTYSLGSCIGVTIYDPVARIAGMIHCMLPLSKIDPQKAKNTPCMFVDTGVPFFINEAYRLGAEKKRIIVKIAGCSSLLDSKGLFKIGERNHTVLRKILWKNNMLIEKQDIGGNISRTVSIEVATGRVVIKSGGKEWEL